MTVSGGMEGSYLYWPTSGIIAESRRGNLKVVGWRLNNAVVVIAIVDEWRADTRMNQDETFEVLCKLSGRKVELLGLTNNEEPRRSEPNTSKQATSRKLGGDLIFHVNGRSTLTAASPKMPIILFDPPDPRRLRYLTTGFELTDGTYAPPRSRMQEEMSKQDAYGLLQAQRGDSSTMEQGGIEDILELLNNVKQAQRIIETQRRSTSNHHKALFDETLTSACSSVIALTTWSLEPCFIIARAVMHALNTELGVMGTPVGSIRGNSAFVHQLCLRLDQTLDSPRRFKETLTSNDSDLKSRSAKYITFWNTAWLIINDLILGYCTAKVLLEMKYVIAEQLPVLFRQYEVNSLLHSLRFLNDWPVGLKLNTPLSQFYSSTLSTVVQYWSNIVTPYLVKHFMTIVAIAAYSAFGGLTFLFAVMRDFLAIIALHIWICDRVTSAICKWQLVSLGGLWNLFRGKRWNALRQRTDAYAYDVDQLFLGTLLFTVSVFLFPTVATYAALFAVARLLCKTSDKVLKAAINALNAFPLFEVLLRIKEPSRLPDGITIDLRVSKDLEKPPVLELRNSPKSLSKIFWISSA